METQRYEGLRLRAFILVLPLCLITLAGAAWLLLGYLEVQVFGFVVQPWPWYAWVAVCAPSVAAAVVYQQIVLRMPCPRCGAKPLKASHGGDFVYLTCTRCSIRWNTGVDDGSRQPH